MQTFILGIDDAGRGPVIGPMVLAGCLIEKQTESEFHKFGVKDSKQLTRKRREFLEKLIKEKAAAFSVQVTHPTEIDGQNKQGTNLNDVEALMAASIINELNKTPRAEGKIRVVIDCPSPNRVKWREDVLVKVENLSNLEIVCEHKADRNHMAVSAASIIAKEERERQMKILKEKYGADMGSGYASDPNTKKFLENNVRKLNDQGIFRKSWDTWKRVNDNLGQKKLL